MKPIVIVGTGLAGYTLARELRKLDRETPLTILSADDGHFYSKPMLSNAFAQGKDAATLVNTPAEKMAAQLGAEIRPHTRVLAIDATARKLQLENGSLDYDRLILAWGADPIRLPLEGDAAEQALSVNDLSDYARFRTSVATGKRVLIMGAGLIGCEFANDLAGAGHEVDVVDPAPQALGRLLPPEAAQAMAEALGNAGIRFHFGRTVRRIDRAESGLAITLDNTEPLETDTVLSAIGLRPRIDIAREAGLAVNRGICVDARLQTSLPGIYALGDCAEIEGLVLPYVLPIMHAARALARSLAGEPTAVRYPAMPVVVKTPACPAVVAPPPAGIDGRWEVEGEGADRLCRFLDRNDALRGFALTGSATSQKASLAATLPPLLN